MGELGGTYHEVVGADVGQALLEAARSLNVTQLVMGATRRSRWQRLTRGSVIGKVIRESGVPIDVHVISHPEAGSEEAFVVPRTRRPAALPRERVALGAALALVGLPLLTVVLAQLRDQVELASVMLLFLLLVAVVAAVGGLWPGLGAAVGGFLLVNWYFIEPVHTFTIEEAEDVLALFVFLAVGAIVSGFVALASRRAAEGARARAEAEALARLAGSSTVAAVLEGLRRVLGLEGAAVLHRHEGGWRIEAASGERVPESPEASTDTVELDPEHVLALAGAPIRSQDRRILDAFATELAASVAPRRARGRGRGGGRSLRHERAARRPPVRRLARPPHAHLRDQGVGDEPAPAGRRAGRPRHGRSSSRRSTRRPTGSTRSSATCST